MADYTVGETYWSKRGRENCRAQARGSFCQPGPRLSVRSQEFKQNVWSPVSGKKSNLVKVVCPFVTNDQSPSNPRYALECLHLEMLVFGCEQI